MNLHEYLDAVTPTFVQRKPDASAVFSLVKEGVSPLLAKLYASRGVLTRREAEARWEDLIPHSELLNCGAMAKVLADAVRTQDFVLIVSDYDCDGATACAVLIAAFQAAGMNFAYLVPDRFKHGYGLTPSIVEEAHAQHPQTKFIITVDNGISSTYGVDRARELGIEVLVTDHHLAPAELPKAKLIVNPNQPGCEFPSKNIAGCGVAWYVAWALFDELEARGIPAGYDPEALLPYVALGTVADVVKLDQNNRILVKEGMFRIRSKKCAPGIHFLAKVAKRDLRALTTADIGFGIGPRINAAGRMAHMSAGIECLTTASAARAEVLAAELHETNEERKEKQDEMLIEAADLWSRRTNTDAKSVVVYSDEWHEGVVGIVAGRIKDLRNRPTFVFCDAQDGNIKGSGRSIDGFHLKHALDEINVRCPGVLLKFGGHAMAAGATVAAGRLTEFQEAFERVCQEHLTEELLVRKLHHDGPVPAALLNTRTLFEVSQEIWGQGIPEPVFYEDTGLVSFRLMGDEKLHLRLNVKLHGQELPVVAFGMGPLSEDLAGKFMGTVKPSLNSFRGETTVQLLLDQLDPDCLADKAAAALEPALKVA